MNLIDYSKPGQPAGRMWPAVIYDELCFVSGISNFILNRIKAIKQNKVPIITY